MSDYHNRLSHPPCVHFPAKHRFHYDMGKRPSEGMALRVNV